MFQLPFRPRANPLDTDTLASALVSLHVDLRRLSVIVPYLNSVIDAKSRAGDRFSLAERKKIHANAHLAIEGLTALMYVLPLEDADSDL